MSKEYVFPEKWCILWESKERYEVINNYLNTIRKMDWCYTNDQVHAKTIVTYDNHYINNSTPNKVPRGYTLISFEQFKEYVLKEEIVEPELIIEDLDYLVDLFKQLNIK